MGFGRKSGRHGWKLINDKNDFRSNKFEAVSLEFDESFNATIYYYRMPYSESFFIWQYILQTQQSLHH